MSATVELIEAEKVYGTIVETRALAPTSLTLEPGELVVILGPSGSGKTTLLNLIGGLDRPSGGRIAVDGRELGLLDRQQLSEYRRQRVGFIFQFFNLIPTLTALENVTFAYRLNPGSRSPEELLDAVGLGERLDAFPAELSGGQQQRVAVARALAKDPDLILCDEPTGALDEGTGKQVLALLQDATRGQGRTVLIVTHNTALAAMADRVIQLKDGKVIEDRRREQPRDASEVSW